MHFVASSIRKRLILESIRCLKLVWPKLLGNISSRIVIQEGKAIRDISVWSGPLPITEALEEIEVVGSGRLFVETFQAIQSNYFVPLL